MGLFAIGDLHLSATGQKPMDKFGDIWKNHGEKIRQNWTKIVAKNDMVLILGDISWAMKMEDALPDLYFIQSLPGTKVLLCGNHDYWWSSMGKLQSLFGDMKFLKNNFFTYEDYALCGTRGWLCPNDTYFTEHDEKIYKREQMRLKGSIESAIACGYEKILVLLHFPPTNDKKEYSGFLQMIESYPQIKKVFYGHLHGENAYDASIKGMFSGVEYDLVSSDYINFCPRRIF